MPDKLPKNLPDRPFKCTECKKAIAVVYTEIIGETVMHTAMCADCPELQRRLRGADPETKLEIVEGTTVTGLACGNCGTTLDSLQRGNLLGCPDCYEVFGETILIELQTAHKIPARITSLKKTKLVHIGRAPGETQEINPALRLLALNEALSETLQKEDYEQAAWLRDQIKALTEKAEEKNNGKD